jgi:protein SCO1/2
MKTYARIIPFALAAVIITAGCQSHTATKKISSLPEIKKAPAFEFTNYDGTVVTNNDLSGDIYIVEFFFTSCGGPCPIMNSTANVLQSEFMDIPNFRIVSFTVDPETDDLARLTKYADRYNAKPDRWYFLRNSKEIVAQLSSKGFMMGDASQPAMHSTRFALVDTKGMIRGYFDGTDKEKVDELREAIRYLVEDRA